MTPLKCTSVAGEEGDCYRTCLAMILNIAPGLIPNFAEIYKEKDSVHEEADAWLAQYGLSTGNSVMHPETDPHMIPEFVNNINPGVPAIWSGRSENGVGHSVVVCGGEVFNPSSTEILQPFPDANGGLGGYWISFIVAGANFRIPPRVPVERAEAPPLTPEIMVQMGKAEYAVRFRTDTGELHLIRNVKNVRGEQGLGSLYLHTWAHRYKGGTPGPHTQAGIIAAVAREKLSG